MPLQPGQTQSHYHLLSKIGESGMGEVYLAGDATLMRKVALKVLPAPRWPPIRCAWSGSSARPRRSRR